MPTVAAVALSHGTTRCMSVARPTVIEVGVTSA
jgi:hypothetical protein